MFAYVNEQGGHVGVGHAGGGHVGVVPVGGGHVGGGHVGVVPVGGGNVGGGRVAEEPSAIGLLLPFILIFAVFYFLVIRPQHTKMRRHADMVSSLKRGDRVVTSGGIIGEVTKVASDDEVIVRIDEDEKVHVRVVKATIAEIRDK